MHGNRENELRSLFSVCHYVFSYSDIPVDITRRTLFNNPLEHIISCFLIMTRFAVEYIFPYRSSMVHIAYADRSCLDVWIARRHCEPCQASSLTARFEPSFMILGMTEQGRTMSFVTVSTLVVSIITVGP